MVGQVDSRLSYKKNYIFNIFHLERERDVDRLKNALSCLMRLKWRIIQLKKIIGCLDPWKEIYKKKV